MALRRPDVCVACGSALDAGSRAEWNPSLKAITCLACVEKRTASEPDPASVEQRSSPTSFERGTPGASARRKYEKLHDRREEHAKQKLGRRIGGVYLALSTEPQSTRAWGIGSKGERRLGEYLESIHDESRVIVLHDRRIPGSKANIDHIAVCRNGIYAIDAKNYAGKVQRIDRGGWFSTDLRLYVGRRDCTRLVGGMGKQIEAIRSALGEAVVQEFEIDVKAALCFVDAEWSLFAKPFRLNEVWVGWAKALGEQLLADGPLAGEHLITLARRVAAALPPA
ncbi:Nuclease-related protein [Gaiella occulta]|uniref:Nuclease-related protein n=1 Tax=Gaiella occulta TaxID=1002870 RepID=A0A7M2YWZ0_9ACTN|nr:nuclease-related domain-containing protein [Gaiella occulta]RDI74404.1 Nuclease-related protein [Gaiella occulta]